jgi:hypothetical protein
VSLPRLVFSHPRDNLLRQAASIVVTQGELDDSTVADLFDGNPGKPFRIAGTSLTLDAAFAAPVTPEFPAILNSNLSVAARLQGSDTDLDSPDVDEVFAVPSLGPSGFSTSPFLDLRDAGARLKWRLKITANGSPIAIGQFWLGARFRTLAMSVGLAAGAEGARTIRTVRHETSMGTVLAYQQAPLCEAIGGSTIVQGADWTAVREWHEACGGARPCVVVWRSDVVDAWMVRWADDALPYQSVGVSAYEVQVSLRQLSRGLPWVDPDEV